MADIDKPEDTKNIEEYLKLEKRKYDLYRKEPKLLALGSSDSGKSTLLKQLKIIYGNGFTKQEIQSYKSHIIQSILHVIEFLLSKSPDDIQSTYQHLNTFIQQQKEPLNYLSDDTIQLIQNWWSDSIIQFKFIELQSLVPDSIAHFFEKIGLIATKNGTLTNDDILLARIPTQSVSDTIFDIPAPNSTTFKLHYFDVSGLIHHRKHWISYFEDVATVIFIISLNAYDQVLVEDPTINRMHDSLTLFDEIVNHPLLDKPGIMLFLNKKDLYEKKIKNIPIQTYFPDYVGILIYKL
ncbi:guanine nucleotide binding protein, alpha subunit [Globomyces pollinis-pini]|nr:guanine nucleotide binding protein, alpha subunit [Globomyces pollinis-pini]